MPDLRKLKDKATEMVAKGKFEKAADLYKEILAADPKDIAIQQRLAEALRKAGDNAGAVAAYRRVADRYGQEGHLIKAIAICKIILEIDPAHSETQGALAQLYAKKQGGPGGDGKPAAGKVSAASIRGAQPMLAGGGPRQAAMAPAPMAAAQAAPVAVPAAPTPLASAPAEPLFSQVTPFEAIMSAAQAAPADGGEVTIEAGGDGSGEEEVVLLTAADELPPEPAATPETRKLPTIPIFSDLSQSAFVALAEGMNFIRKEKDEVLVREGEVGDSFFVIATGRVRVTKRDETGSEVMLAHLGEGAFFGEMALLSGAPRAATITADEPCEILELKAQVLMELCGQYPNVAESLKKFYRQRLLANVLAVSPFFRPFEKRERKVLVERFRSREVRAGEVVVAEGREADGLYVVLGGAVDIRKRNEGREVLVGRLAEGDVFGEISCLKKGAALASAVMFRNGTLLRLPRESFDELVVTYPQILALVSDLADERASHLEAILSGQAEFTDDGLVLT
jgi:CRP-like cAMP-binding protein